MEIDRTELLRYLGWRGQELDGTMLEKLDGAAKRCLGIAEPRSVMRRFALNEDLSLGETGFRLEGEDIKKHLAGCREVYLIAATIGLAAERELAKLSAVSMEQALLFDTAASCAVESYCDDICEDLENHCQRALTSRFSCGYGDFPLTAQKEIYRILDTEKKIGLYADKNYLLTPRKSVTAVAGITDAPAQARAQINCGNGCNNRCGSCGKTDCSFRKTE